MPNTLVRSARNPVNMKFDSRTSFWISLEIFSTVPGFDSPRAALLSENDPYASFRTEATALSVRNASGDVLSAMVKKCEGKLAKQEIAGGSWQWERKA
jgi:hypothetical protein